MPPALTATLRRLTHTLREFTVGQRTIAIIGLAVLIVGGVGLTAWMSQPSYSPLFTSLSPTDAGSITTMLHTDGVPYQLADGGDTILVPQQDVDSERLKAASAGLPSLSNDGYGLLNTLGVTASAFQQTTTYQRALQGELANTIEAMNGVETASVKLAIPDQTVFTSQQQATTASVFVRTQGNTSLGASQVAAITHLVAASVDNLKPTDVSVVSADGTLLSGSGATTSGGGATDSTYESRTQSSVQAMLDRILGAGNSTVVVSADLSSESGQRVTQTYTVPTNAPALSEQNSTTVDGSGGSGSGGSGTGATGVLGPDNIAVPTSNPTSSATSGTASGTGNGSSYTTSSTKNNAINQTTETTNVPAGELDRQTISIAVNKAASSGVSASNIEKLVSGAAGVDLARGDQVDVQIVPFSKAGAAQAQQAINSQSGADLQDNIVKIATTAVTVLGVLLGLFLLFRFLSAATKRREPSPIDIGPLEARTLPGDPQVDLSEYPPSIGGGSQLPGQLPGGGSPATLMPGSMPNTFLPGAQPLDGQPVEQPEHSRMRASIDRMSATDPARTAEYLRSLMDDKQPA